MDPVVMLNMVAACARVKYPAQMLRAVEACFTKINEFTNDQLVSLTSHLATTPIARIDDAAIKQGKVVKFLVLHLESVMEKPKPKQSQSQFLDYLINILHMAGDDTPI